MDHFFVVLVILIIVCLFVCLLFVISDTSVMASNYPVGISSFSSCVYFECVALLEITKG